MALVIVIHNKNKRNIVLYDREMLLARSLYYRYPPSFANTVDKGAMLPLGTLRRTHCSHLERRRWSCAGERGRIWNKDTKPITPLTILSSQKLVYPRNVGPVSGADLPSPAAE